MAVVERRLIEREREFEHGRAALDRAHDDAASTLLFEAAAGLGKTHLLERLAQQARDGGATVLHARSSELERDLAFGVVRQLFEPAVLGAKAAKRRALLADAARVVEPLLSGEPAAESPTPETPETLLRGLFWLLVNLSADGPVALIIDDLHWADDPSLRFLSHLLARLRDVPVAILLGMRPPEGSDGSPLAVAVALDPGVRVLQLRPLSEAGVAELVRSQFPDAASEFCRACERATAGNPFFLSTLLDELARNGTAPTEDGARRIHDLGPRAIWRSILGRLAGIGEAAVQVAFAVAVLGDAATVAEVAALTGVVEADVVALADALGRAAILRRHEELSFVHPIVRRAVYVELAPNRRAQWHSRATDLLLERGAARDRVLPHVLAAAPAARDDRVDFLRDAAHRALGLGAPEAAAAYLRRALCEPPPPATASELKLELGIAATLAGEPDGPILLQEVRASGEQPQTRASAAIMLSRMATYAMQIPDAVELLKAALGELQAVDPGLAVGVEAELLSTALLDTRTAATGLAGARRLRARLPQLKGPDSGPALAFLACAGATTGEPPDETAQLALTALDGGRLLREVGPDAQMLYPAIFALTFTERYDDALQALDEAVEEAVRRGSAVGFIVARTVRAQVNYRRGAIPEAEADARDALEAAGPQIETMRIGASAFLAEALVERGQLAEATQVAEEADPGTHGTALFAQLLYSRGRVRIANGRSAEALSDLLECSRRLEAISGADTPNTIPWRGAAARASLALGDDARAQALAREQLDLARKHRLPGAVGAALIACAECERGNAAVALLGEAVDVLETSSARLEHARALVALGAAVRRSGRRSEARESLRAGLDMARACGATVLADLALQELLATGARPRRLAFSGSEALTPSELRVARMAADGLSNPQIAQALFVTRKTVESHLAAAYSKLGVGGRAELRPALSKSDPDAASEMAG